MDTLIDIYSEAYAYLVLLIIPLLSALTIGAWFADRFLDPESGSAISKWLHK